MISFALVLLIDWLLSLLIPEQARLDFDSKKLQSFVKEQSLILSEKGALSDKIGPGVLKSLVTLSDK